MDVNSIMQQAQQMQAKLIEMQQELAKRSVQGSAGGGMVTVTVNGRGEILSVKVENELLTPDEAEMLQDLIVAATNDGLRKAREMGRHEMGKLTGGMNLPGVADMF